MVKVIAPLSKPTNQGQPTLFISPAICSQCWRETIPIGPNTYPRRCPRCGNRWHTVLSREQNLLSLSNVELPAPLDNTEDFQASRVIKYFPDGSGYSVHYKEWGQMTEIMGPPRLIQVNTPGDASPPAE